MNWETKRARPVFAASELSLQHDEIRDLLGIKERGDWADEIVLTLIDDLKKAKKRHLIVDVNYLRDLLESTLEATTGREWNDLATEDEGL